MVFCHLQIAFSAHGRIRQIRMYFLRYLIGSILTACFPVVIKVDLYDLVIFDHFWPSDWRGNRDEFLIEFW